MVGFNRSILDIILIKKSEKIIRNPNIMKVLIKLFSMLELCVFNNKVFNVTNSIRAPTNKNLLYLLCKKQAPLIRIRAQNQIIKELVIMYTTSLPSTWVYAACIFQNDEAGRQIANFKKSR